MSRLLSNLWDAFILANVDALHYAYLTMKRSFVNDQSKSGCTLNLALYKDI